LSSDGGAQKDGCSRALVAQDMNLEDQYNRAVFSAFWSEAVNVTAEVNSFGLSKELDRTGARF
jgi:hypothetical protein